LSEPSPERGIRGRRPDRLRHIEGECVFKRIAKLGAVTAAALMVTATAAVAHEDSGYIEDGAYDNAKATHGHDTQQHGGDEGHLEARNTGFDVVSKLAMSRVSEGKVADVGIFKDTAYLAAWGGQTCKYNGVHVVDIADVTNPQEIAFIPSKEGSYPGEGVQALEITTAAFSGDILVTNNEKCKQPAGFGGMNIYDVSDPANPEVLTQGFGDAQGHNKKQSAHQTHSVFAWQDGANAYAVMVDNEEADDIDIVDITNPRKPVVVAEYDLAQEAPQILQPDAGLDEVFLHDMVVKKIDGRQVMLASYWDGGYVQLDVTNDGAGVPAEPVVLADSDFPDPDSQGVENGLTTPDGTPVPPEGNAHQAEFTGDNAFVIGADEDFSPFATTAVNETDGTDLVVSSGSDTKKLEPGTEVTGETKFGGRACNGDAAVPAGDGTQIAVVERGVCTFTEKVSNVLAAGGYEAVVIFNRTGSDGCNNSLGMSVRGDIHTFGVAPREQGFQMFDQPFDEAACKAGNGSQLSGIELGKLGDTLSFGSYFDGWGYVRLLDGETMDEVDTYAIPEAHDQDFADGFGDLSVHEVAVSKQDDRLAFLSYYSGGVRAIRIAEGEQGTEIQEVGAFIDEGGNNFWGVEVFEQDGVEYAALSDRDFGLYIVKLSSAP
jgi:hypothetical protein